jgi:DNA polymerase elongation subunit (family B)/predicted RNA-binding Zn-ribbon protein involved in translation (DUF1610 family)
LKTDTKTVIFDIETSPIIVPTFSLWGEVGGNHKSILQDWYVISVAWKTLGEKKVHAVSVLDDAKRFGKDHTDDYHVVKTIHEVLLDADVIVGHNIAKFDWKKLNTRFIKHGLKPLPKKKMSDTYKTAKREFNFTSNRLDYIAAFLGLETKMETPKGLWLDVLKGSRDAVKTMVKYNKQDIVVSEQVYLKLRPYDTTPVNASVGSETTVCPKCGGKHVQKQGTMTLSTGKYQKYQCQDCGGWFRDKVNLLSKAARKAVTVSQ